MSGAIPPLTQYALMAWCSAKKDHRDILTFYLKGLTKLYFSRPKHETTSLQSNAYDRNVWNLPLSLTCPSLSARQVC
jgi:hypothetical protein